MHPSGVINVNKPAGPTSHDVIAIVRRGTGVKRVGHAGTLDPLASGVLPVLVGAATRLSEYLLGHDKHYRATVRFGATTETLDAGSPAIPGGRADFRPDEIEEALERFRGPVAQIPPAYSAIKVGGRKAYAMARAGEPVELTSRRVTFYELKVLAWASPDLELDIHCSSGTYIRSLARDLGLALGTGAYLAKLERRAVGGFTLEDSIALTDLKVAMAEGNWQTHLISPADALPDLPALPLDQAQALQLIHGRPIRREPGSPSGLVRGLGSNGELVALLKPDALGHDWRPEKVFHTSFEQD